MTQAIAAGAIAVAALNLIAGVLGAWLWYDGGPGERAAGSFWALLRAAQGAALVLALAVGSLAAAGNYSTDHLFYLYALLPLAVGFIAEQLRATSAQTILDQRDLPDAQAVGSLPEEEQRRVVREIVRREIGVMALSALVTVFLALRAAGTAHGF
ncbi:MAG TPA: hypothetical protein VHW67_00255 [Solirubrobacteraceae bacterium]|jgi:hypothetical protein|nr:hypothetical protein [Solirubrobacteraceae bacterium]